MPTFTFFKLSSGHYALHSPYDAAFVEDLKSSLEWWERKWDDTSKLWKIDRNAFKRAAEVCVRHGKVVYRENGPDEPEKQRQAEAQAEREHQERKRKEREQQAAWERQRREQQERQRRQQAEDSRWWPGKNEAKLCPYRMLHLQPDAPLAVVTAVWRALCHLHHPDKGGSLEQMQRINAAYDLIKRERGQR